MARDELSALPVKIQRQIGGKINALAINPRPTHCKKLEEVENLYRIRAGDYRIVYQVRDEILMVLVIRVGHRKNVYRRLPKKESS